MSKRRGPQGPDIRDVKPTRIIMDLKMTIDGGSIGASQELSDVWVATLKAFEATARRVGLGFSWVGQIACMNPKRMDARIERTKLEMVFPLADAANTGVAVEGSQTSDGRS